MYPKIAMSYDLKTSKDKGASMMSSTTLLLILLLHATIATSTQNTTPFLFEGFKDASLNLSNSAVITSDGLIRLTDNGTNQIGHAFFPTPLKLKNSTSFSTAFVFAFVYPNDVGDHGMAFALSPSPTLPHSSSGHYLGLFNMTSNNNPSSHIFAIELDTVKNGDVNDANANHVGIDVNGLTSKNSTNASYYQNGKWKDLDLHSGEAMQVWVEYNASTNVVEVTLAPLRVPKPQVPLLSSTVNLSSILANETYVGFTASTGGAYGFHYVLGWNFSMDGELLQPLDPSHLPRLPRGPQGRKLNSTLIIALVMIALVLVLPCIGGITYWVRRERRFAELVEEEELLYGPTRISYKDLYKATKGFKEENLLGAGGFGRVYKGTLPRSHDQVAVKKISHDSSQGVKEFVAEITSMARLRHRNLVQLIGYCRRKGELLLVYDYMENGSLDKFLHGPKAKEETLSWEQRFKVAKGVAEGLCYLHEGWEQVVVHRDVKASNVLLDADYNGRLGDFGLAKIFDRGDVHQQTTRVVGTLGYMAPEMARTGKATTFTDVFAFGAFLLEVVCGKPPMIMTKNDDGKAGTTQFLEEWVLELWRRGSILAAVDLRLGRDYPTVEVETLLKLGVLCSHGVPPSRPSMRQVVQVLEGELLLPVAPPGSDSGPAMATVVAVAEDEAPTTSVASQMEWQCGKESSSFDVEKNSLVDDRDLYSFAVE